MLKAGAPGAEEEIKIRKGCPKGPLSAPLGVPFLQEAEGGSRGDN